MDLINSLPEEILCYILSFLSTKEAVSTSVLSKRWHSLWKGVHNLDFNDSVFFNPEEGKREREGNLQSFMDFVDRVLALHDDSPIKKFSLKCKPNVHAERVNLWIRNVLQRGVSDIDLVLDYNIFELMDWKTVQSKTLVNVKARRELPMLKTLNIDSVNLVFLSDRFEVFVSSFPMLEELRLATMQWWLYSDETVSSASLRKLTILAKGFFNLSNRKSIYFDTPNLVYLEYSDYVAADYPKINLTNLVEARLNLMVTEAQIGLIRAQNGEEDDGFIRRFRNVSKLMSGMRNAKKLSLSADTLEVISLSCDSMPVFNNLKCLHITSRNERGWQAMPVLLRNCPHLETIVLQGLLHHETDKCGDACDCIIREDKGVSLASCPVKMLKIKGFLGTSKEMAMIKHFLVHFPGLKEMDIFVEKDEPIELGVMFLIEDYDKLSSCHVQLRRVSE